MRLALIFMAGLATALLSGCASSNGLVLGTVGPQPLHLSAFNSTTGTLVVYSAYETGAEFNIRNEFYRSHSDYKIFAGDGTLLRKVHNNTETFQQNPVTVPLAPGKYTVAAQANGYDDVTIPVIIAPQQTTVIHLEGGGVWPDESAFNQTNSVRLPDGMVIGWKSGT
jgi:hypothetical protein